MRTKRFLSAALALMMVFSMTIFPAEAAVIGAPARALTDQDTMSDLFPDEAFRTVVQEAMDSADDDAFYNGTKPDFSTLQGFALVRALGDYIGEIDAKGKGISDAHGLEFLRKASFVDLSKNNITDFEFLWNAEREVLWTIDRVDRNEHITPYIKLYYGTQSSAGQDATNVRWKLNGNPFETLPSDFGGRLVIEQPATGSSTYDESGFRPRVYLRGEMPGSMVMNIARCKVFDTTLGTPGLRWVVPIKGADNPRVVGQKILTPLEFDAEGVRLTFSDVIKSGKQMLGIGIGEEIHYNTTDEYDTETPGSQSFKYYIHPQFFVYDKVTVGYEDSVTLTKKAEDGTPMAGAKYELRNVGDETPIGIYTTDGNGLLAITEGLSLGDFTLTEIEAPAGYELDSTPFTFTISAVQNEITLGGGKSEIQTTRDEDVLGDNSGTYPKIVDDGIQKSAGANTVLIAGPDVNGASPDVTLTPASGKTDGDYTAHVIYSALELEHDDDGNATRTESVTRAFQSLSAAVTDINNEKNENHIVGNVAINISATGTNAFHFEHTNQKTPPPVDPPSNPPNGGPVISHTSIKGEKIWVDDDNAGNTRPSAVKVELYRDGALYRTASVGKSSNWTYRFDRLPHTHSDGHTEYEYIVREANIPEGYTSEVSEDNKTITNTLIPPEAPPVDPEEPQEPPVEPPTDPDEPHVVPPEVPPTDPGEPPVVPPEVPPTAPVEPPTVPPELPQTGTMYGTAGWTLLGGASILLAAFFWRKRREYE